MIRSMIFLVFIFCSNLSALGFKFKTGLHVILYQLSVPTCRGEQLLRMIPSFCLFTNVHEIKQQHKLEPKIKFDRSF